MKYIRPYVAGILSYLPGGSRVRVRGTGGTVSARYCYSVWMRHLLCLRKAGMTHIPAAIAELGPGDSLGIGLAAMLCGCEDYTALDVVPYASKQSNLNILQDLVRLFHERADIPSEAEFPGIRPEITCHDFPRGILGDDLLARTLHPDRLGRIERDVRELGREGGTIRYRVPWYREDVIRHSGVELIYSQAVLEHVDDLALTYRAMSHWLMPKGWMSHQIDFRSHGLTPQWDGHWALSPLQFAIMRGRRPYLLNRSSVSTHRQHWEDNHFQVRCELVESKDSTIDCSKVQPGFRQRPVSDWTTCGIYVAGQSS